MLTNPAAPRELPELPPIDIARVQAFVLRSPVETPVQTSFGIMRDRPAVFVKVTDTEGAVGWGEIWCNFPGCGAEHRARLVQTVLAPLLSGEARRVIHPATTFADLTQRTTVLALQSGEPGPIAQSIAGLDLALWDLHARRAGEPLWRLLGGAGDTIRVYASGLNPTGAGKLVEQHLARGFDAFKLKVGFGRERDLASLRELRAMIGARATLMADANQGWDLDQALAMTTALEPFALGWLEEPLRCDQPIESWQALHRHSTITLAAGENIAGTEAFQKHIASGALGVVQPDIAKWGGISGTWPITQAIQSAGLTYCPHYLGGGVGLLASAHLLAAAGDSQGRARLEVDANPNPLRSVLAGAIEHPEQGRVKLGEAPGIGALDGIDELLRDANLFE